MPLPLPLSLCLRSPGEIAVRAFGGDRNVPLELFFLSWASAVRSDIRPSRRVREMERSRGLTGDFGVGGSEDERSTSSTLLMLRFDRSSCTSGKGCDRCAPMVGGECVGVVLRTVSIEIRARRALAFASWSLLSRWRRGNLDGRAGYSGKAVDPHPSLSS